MNNFPSREQVQALRERYPPGTMIQLTADMKGERLRAGDIGKVTHVDDIGTIHTAWQSGSSLGLIPARILSGRLLRNLSILTHTWTIEI